MLKNSKAASTKRLQALRDLPVTRSINLADAQHGVPLLRGLLIAGCGILVVVLFVLVVDPVRQLAQARDAERTDAANALVSALYKFAATNAGRLPADVQSATLGSAYLIGTATSACDQACGDVTLQPTCLDLGSELVGSYMAALPIDPKHGTAERTGYYVERTANNLLTVGACQPERTSEIRISR